jgi:hypothetical protein
MALPAVGTVRRAKDHGVADLWARMVVCVEIDRYLLSSEVARLHRPARHREGRRVVGSNGHPHEEGRCQQE